MRYCTVKNCKNNQWEERKGDPVSFFHFPRDSERCSMWMNNIAAGGDEKCILKRSNFICSDHFEEKHMYKTAKGLRKLTKTAVPTLNLGPLNKKYTDKTSTNLPVEGHACRICLQVDRRLYCMMEYNLLECYEQFTGLKMEMEDEFPHKLCWECARRLMSFKTLKAKAIRSYNLLMELLNSSQEINIKTINSIDRVNNKLISDLTSKNFAPNHFDLVINAERPKIEINIEESKVDVAKRVKIEVNDLSDIDDLGDDDYVDDVKIEIDEIQKVIAEVDRKIDRDLAKGDKKRDDDDSNSDDSSSDSKDTDDLKDVSYRIKEKKTRTGRPRKTISARKKAALVTVDENMFDITDISVEEQIKEIEKRKDSAKFKNADFRCMVCFKAFFDEDVYNGHTLRHMEKSGSFECQVCKVRFKTRYGLNHHFSSHLKRFSCKCCQFVTTRKVAAKKHQDYHKGVKYECKHCQKDFLNISTYRSHLRMKHPSDSVCVLCGDSFASANGLRLHMQLKHKFDDHNVPPDGPKCEKCDVTFRTKDALEKHLDVSPKHNVDDAEAARARYCKRLEKGRQKKKVTYAPIQCEQCDAQLPDSRAYHHHFIRHHPEKNRTRYISKKSISMCEVCGKVFQSLAALRDHSYTHGDNAGGRYRCSICGREFARQHQLSGHRRVAHPTSNTPKHPCQVCGKVFTSSPNMRRHMFGHTGLKPFKCEMCGKDFKNEGEKKVHIKYVHLKKPWPKRSRNKTNKITVKRDPSGQTQLAVPMPSLGASDEEAELPVYQEPKSSGSTDHEAVYYG